MTHKPYLEPDIEKKVYAWLDGPYDEQTKNHIKVLLKHDLQTLRDVFSKDLSFGTGGIRALMGVGTNRLNIYTIQTVTQGLANYIYKTNSEKTHRVAICYDSRNHSRFFAEETAKVLIGNGIEVFLSRELRPTPFTSFTCRYLKCSSAVMITASHNPPQYNGYKVYWSDGAQVVSPHDRGIVEEIEKIKDPILIKKKDLSGPLFHTIDEEVDNAYIQAIKKLQTFPEESSAQGKNLNIIYSPLHGTGITLVPKALTDWGFTSLSFVEKQKNPDGNFPTAPSPNPEEENAMQLGIEQLLLEKADIFIATDPDADRLGVAVLHEGKPVRLTGNEFAALCVYHLCKTLTEKGFMPENGAFVTTIVTTELLKVISASFHRPCFEVLTGFKYIGEKIRQWEINQKYTFIFGAEESYGCLLGTHVRDKDAIVCSCLIAEIALHAKMQGKTLIDILYEIYREYGIYREQLISIEFGTGADRLEKMKSLIENLRQHPPKEILDTKISEIEDYLHGIRTYVHNNQKENLNLPKSDVLSFRLADRSKITIRPSGTEPKIKIYGMIQEMTSGSMEEGIKHCDTRLSNLLNALKDAYFII